LPIFDYINKINILQKIAAKLILKQQFELQQMDYLNDRYMQIPHSSNVYTT